MNLKILFVLIFVSFAAAAQQMVVKNSRSYPSTDNWNFISENYALTGITKVQVAKTEKGGLLRLAVETTNAAFILSGTAYVFLTDNTILTCTDKGNREVIGNEIITYYTFSTIEMNKLKTTEIQSIHFNIKGNSNGFSSQIGNFTALNRTSYFATAFDKSKKSFDTAQQITALYK
jgi:hypothetical protein